MASTQKKMRMTSLILAANVPSPLQLRLEQAPSLFVFFPMQTQQLILHASPINQSALSRKSACKYYYRCQTFLQICTLLINPRALITTLLTVEYNFRIVRLIKDKRIQDLIRKYKWIVFRWFVLPC